MATSSMAAPATLYERRDGGGPKEPGDFRCLVPGCSWEVKGAKRRQIWEHMRSKQPIELANHPDKKHIMKRMVAYDRKRRGEETVGNKPTGSKGLQWCSFTAFMDAKGIIAWTCAQCGKAYRTHQACHSHMAYHPGRRAKILELGEELPATGDARVRVKENKRLQAQRWWQEQKQTRLDSSDSEVDYPCATGK